jgi:sugar-specific transcriptional regulator TrmB
MEFEQLLKNIGLSDGEIAVYLASLSLGPSPVQNIARKAHTPRASAYALLRSLAQLGLVTQYKDGKKTLFAPESPQQLFNLIEKQEYILQRKRLDIEQALPGLQALLKQTESKPTVRYFPGLDGLRTMRQEVLMHSTSKDTWYNLMPADYVRKVFGDKELLYSAARVAKRIRAKTIFTTTSEDFRKRLLANAHKELAERKCIPSDVYKSTSGYTIYHDRIAFSTFAGDIGGVIIENEALATMMRESFLAWWAKVQSYSDKVSRSQNRLG